MEYEIKNVVFDIGEVLVKFNWREYLKSFGFSKETEEDLGQIIFQSAVWDERDRGLFGKNRERVQSLQHLHRIVHRREHHRRPCMRKDGPE